MSKESAIILGVAVVGLGVFIWFSVKEGEKTAAKASDSVSNINQLAGTVNGVLASLGVPQGAS